MATSKERITEKAIAILESHPDGLRYSKLIKEISNAMPEVPVNTIHGATWDIDIRLPTMVYKPSRGLFKLLKFKQEDISDTQKSLPVDKKSKHYLTVKEEDFYSPFADWLVNELEDCTKAIPLGGNRFKDKWGTPDVIGKYEPKRSDIIKGSIEIVSAEIKSDSNQLITAFGQTCAYRLFSHKVYIVIPKNAPQEDIARLDSLCMVFGIGLILFNPEDCKNPDFDIRVRAIKHEPDLYYVNKYMKIIEEDLFR